MTLRIVIPVKPFAEAKQRLAPSLPSAERAKLAERLFRHVLGVAAGFAGPRAVIVVSRGADILRLAEAGGATALPETSQPRLNAALAQAAGFALNEGASRLLIVASDLPFVGEADFAAMAEHLCAIAPDRHRRGTNALTWPLQPFPGFHFGDDSLARHRCAAQAAGLDPVTVSLSGLLHDIDVPEDLLERR